MGGSRVHAVTTVAAGKRGERERRGREGRRRRRQVVVYSVRQTYGTATQTMPIFPKRNDNFRSIRRPAVASERNQTVMGERERKRERTGPAAALSTTHGGRLY